MEFTHTIDLDLPSYTPPALFPIAYRELSVPPVHRTAVVNTLVYVYSSLHQINQHLSRRQGRVRNRTSLATDPPLLTFRTILHS
jgi:dynein heavy chain 1